MSLPDNLVDIPHVVCSVCGKEIGVFQIPLCAECRADLADLYADEKISEGRRR